MTSDCALLLHTSVLVQLTRCVRACMLACVCVSVVA